MRSAFSLDPAIPLSTKTANLRSAEVAQGAADELGNSISPDEEDNSWLDLPRRLWAQVTVAFFVL
jgi:hypothetical protein